jgi:hypothetical protein
MQILAYYFRDKRNAWVLGSNWVKERQRACLRKRQLVILRRTGKQSNERKRGRVYDAGKWRAGRRTHGQMMCPQRLARTDQPKQLFVHVGVHIIAPITAAALASFSNKHIDQDTYH